MPKHFWEIEESCIRGQSLEERLREYPEVKAKIETMLSLIENAGGKVEKAAEAEGRIIEELRQMGNEVLHSWARRQQQKKEEECNGKPGLNRKEKKPLLVHTARKDRNSGADLHARPSRGGDSTFFRLGGSGVPPVLGGTATRDHRFWSR